jgi:hypothetical protein
MESLLLRRVSSEEVGSGMVVIVVAVSQVSHESAFTESLAKRIVGNTSVFSSTS